MSHELDLILTMTFGLGAALALGLLTDRLKLSPIVGYLLAGIVVGPFTPGFVAHREIAGQLAEVGVILLMFGIGQKLHPEELYAVRKVAVPGALIQIAAATALGALVGRAASWSWGASIVFGLAVSVASTVVLTRVLSDARALHTPVGHLAVGWLVLEDVFTVLVLVLLPIVAGGSGAGAAAAALSIGLALVKLAALVVFTLVVGRRAIPALLTRVALTGSRELFTLTVLVIALGVAVGSAELFGASMALGAFLGGMVVGQSDLSTRAASEALPMRDAFAVLFFVSVGMLLDPASIVAHWPIALGTLAVVLVGKPVVATAIVLMLGRPAATAVAVGVVLAQIGEFSFILVALGTRLGVLPEEVSQVVVVVAIVSITLNPLLFGARGWMARALSRILPARSAAREPERDEPLPPDDVDRAVVVGYGPVGRTLVRLLRENGIEPTIVELNLETVRALRAEGARAIHGDAAQQEVLRQAGIERAKSLVLTSADTPGDAVIASAKQVNPSVFVLARAVYLRETEALKRAGADLVVAGEGEVALAMTEQMMQRLGATPEQLERERARVREEL